MPPIVKNQYTINVTLSGQPLDYYLENENNSYLPSIADFANKKEEELNTSNITEFINFEVIYTPDYVSKNIETLKKYFKKEISKKKISLDSDEAIKAYNTFSETSSLIAELPFKKVATELTKSGSVKYTLLFPDNKTLMISKPFDKLDDVDTNQVIFSIFQNQELVLSNVAEISDLVKGFKEFLPL